MNAFKLLSLLGGEYEYSFGISVFVSMLVYVFVMYLYVSWDFQVLWGLQEGSQNKDGRARHSAWRNYDDLNEFFWWI